MPLTTTLEVIRDAVQRTADVVAFTDKHPVAYLNKLINRGFGALMLECRAINPEFQPIGSTTITTDGSATMYALPSNMRSILMVEYTDDDGHVSWLTPFEMPERPVLRDPDATTASTHADYYRRIGSNIELLPRPPEDHTALVWYATSVTQLSLDADTFDTVERLDSWVIWWAAREVANERENYVRAQYLSDRMAELLDATRIAVRSLDLNGPARIIDTRTLDRYGRRAQGRWRT